MCHSGPLSYFTYLFHFFKKDYSFSPILHCPYGFQQFFTHNFFSQFLPTIFSQISTDLYRSSQFYLAIPPLFFIAIFYLAPSLQDLHKSSQIFTNPPQIFQRSFKIFLPPSLFTWYLDSRSFRPTLQFSTDLHRSSQIYLAIQPLFIHHLLDIPSPRSSQIFHRSFKDLSKISLPPSPFTWYLDSRSFRPTLQISKSSLSSLISTFHHRSSTDLPKLLFFLHPLLLGIWTVGHSGPLSRSPSFSFPPFYLHFVPDPPQVFQNSPSSIPFHFLSGQSVIPAHSPDLFYLHLLYPAFRTVCHPTNFSKMRIHTKFPTRLP